MSKLSFESILPAQVPVTLGDKVYTLKEATADVSNRFRSEISRCSKVENGQVIVTSPGDAVTANLVLVSKCLYDPEGKLVPVDVIKGWPTKIVEAIIKESLSLCGFGSDDKEEDLKNS